MSALVSLGSLEAANPTADTFIVPRLAAKFNTPICATVRTTLQRGVMAHNRSEIPHHHERRLLQRLRDAGWVKASKILATPPFIEKLVAKGWIERSIVDGHLCYRITDQGLAAKKMPI